MLFSIFMVVLGAAILSGMLYLDKRSGQSNKVFIPYIGDVNLKFWGGIVATLLCIFVFNR